MKITRRTNILIKTVRKFIVRRPASEAMRCRNCDGEMIQAQDCADRFGISSKEVYRLIEADAIRFIETDTNEIFVCPDCFG